MTEAARVARPSGAISSAWRSGRRSVASIAMTSAMPPAGKLALISSPGGDDRALAAARGEQGDYRKAQGEAHDPVALIRMARRGKGDAGRFGPRRWRRRRRHGTIAARGITERARPMSVAFAARAGDLGAVEDKKFLIRDFRLQSGAVLPEADDRLRDLWPARARRPQRGADHPWLHQQPSRRRP